MEERKHLEEVYIYNNEKLIGIAKIYNSPAETFRFYNMNTFSKIKK